MGMEEGYSIYPQESPFLLWKTRNRQKQSTVTDESRKKRLFFLPINRNSVHRPKKRLVLRSIAMTHQSALRHANRFFLAWDSAKNPPKSGENRANNR